jgi:L-threonylcarbamoyladenylate synthase
VLLLRSTQRTEEQIVAEVAACVHKGGTIIFPTETVYGIGCAPENDAAIEAVFVAKGRSTSKPLALHVWDVEQASPFVEEWSDVARQAVQQFWPGPLAIVVKRKAGRYERAACGFSTLSVRCPSHDLCRAILKRAGPLAATSANRSGAPAFRGGRGERDLPAADIAVLAGPTVLHLESTIVDCTQNVPVIVREGALPAAAIVTALGTGRPVR